MVKGGWALVLPWLLAGCGAGEASEPEKRVSAYTVQVPMSEWRMVIDGRTLTSAKQTAMIHAGDVTFEVENTGQEAHAFYIRGHGLDAQTPRLAPGERAQLTVRLEPAIYEVGCEDAGHREKGLAGRVRAQ